MSLCIRIRQDKKLRTNCKEEEKLGRRTKENTFIKEKLETEVWGTKENADNTYELNTSFPQNTNQKCGKLNRYKEGQRLPGITPCVPWFTTTLGDLSIGVKSWKYVFPKLGQGYVKSSFVISPVA